ncbi:EscS/YscS/HrcS family type III secretion system export apparatus protein [Pandoraea sputorum]|uniref:EscS/YscS/HrcS family type III secretion system export apparatus protein n=1 Tax=Pandoraea sputorum TaxID=93222 RepID=A0A239S6C6_9BURK|nr:EscS/YscS/HrcS family type III secretion system export apparatus protein [Pandoraea sputorum]AJC15594.1 EscS/YscS/HrcS family type III secretion system export apparatus protein [Pandoraea sputorum]SNU80986.1 type III secretion system protein SpaQ [Pandoraea sputorum]VVD72402.1 EscS/YscS/HrcS family type III secretion system export apparatus protein [Pandoraea sputorum]VVE74106.1 EscS/YscS/HrcS family type III secretion system export apparatus protein [Pandoraea sputorum]
MDNLIFAGNRALYLVLILSAGPVAVATLVGVIVGLLQTVTQVQEQTLPFGLKLLAVSLSLFLLADWFGETLVGYGAAMLKLAMTGKT